MTPTHLTELIDTNYSSRRDFIEAFNQAAGFEALQETTLSRQLSGAQNITKFAQVAYKLFFQILKISS